MSKCFIFNFVLFSFLNNCGCATDLSDSTAGDFFLPLNGTEHGSPPSLTARDSELVSVPEVRTKHGYLNPRPLSLSTQLPTLETRVCHSTLGWVIEKLKKSVLIIKI